MYPPVFVRISTYTFVTCYYGNQERPRKGCLLLKFVDAGKGCDVTEMT